MTPEEVYRELRGARYGDLDNLSKMTRRERRAFYLMLDQIRRMA